MRNHRNRVPVRRRIGRTLQSADGVGHRDLVVQSKKWLLFESVPIANIAGAFAFGYNNVNISTGAAGIASAVYNRLLTTAALTYEEYRIRRIILRAQPGIGYNNDDRIKSSIFARVDVNSQPVAPTLDNLNSLICSESAVNRTYTERSNVKLVDFRPICFSTGGTGSASRPILPSPMQWYNIEERDAHLWRGATVAPVIPDITIQPNSKFITVWADVEIEFRSRRPDFDSFLFSRDMIPDYSNTLTPQSPSEPEESDHDEKSKTI